LGSVKNWPTTLRLVGVLPSAEGYEPIMSTLLKDFDSIRSPIQSQKIWHFSSQVRLSYDPKIFLRLLQKKLFEKPFSSGLPTEETSV
jgi:hypothetical protein